MDDPFKKAKTGRIDLIGENNTTTQTTATNLVNKEKTQTTIFASMHSFAYYFMPSAIPFFFVNTLALGLGYGYLMMKSNSIWGAVIIHAASDFFLFVAVLANA